MGSHFQDRQFSPENPLPEDLFETSFSNCIIKNIDFSGREMQGSEWDSCEFFECNLSNPLIAESSFDSCEFTHCKLLGISFYECRQLRFDFYFSECQLIQCNFSELNMQKSRFLGCDIADCSFQEANLTGSSFEDSRFRECIFHHSKLQRCSFKNASGYCIDPSTNQVKGAKFSAPEVLNLLQGFGIEILDQ